MVDLGVLPAFLAMILLFLIPPGPDMAYVAAAGLGGGPRAAVAAIAGIGTGMAVYAGLVVLGLGTVARSYPLLLDLVKVGGALYLLWLAWTTVRAAQRGGGAVGEAPAGRSYLRGVLVSLTNPKLILFFLAVLPQFMGRAHDATAQLSMLGAVNVLTEVVLYGAIGVLAGRFRWRFHSQDSARGSGRESAVLGYLAGTVYLVLAVVILVEATRG